MGREWVSLSTSEHRLDADAIVDVLLTSPMYFCDGDLVHFSEWRTGETLA